MADEHRSPPSPAPRRVVLRYEDRWEDLLAVLERDRAAGSAPCPVRDALHALCPDGFTEVGLLARAESRSYAADDADHREDGPITADGLIAGWGHRHGRLLFCSADREEHPGLRRSPAASAKARRIRDHASTNGAPLVLIRSAQSPADGAVGAEFLTTGLGVDLRHDHEAAARLARFAVVTGPLRGAAALEAVAADVVVLAGPHASLAVGGAPALAGAEALRAGLADARAADIDGALAIVGRWLDLLPSNPWEPPPAAVTDPTGDAAPGTDDGAPAPAALDAGTWVEARPGWEPTTRTGLGRIGGTVIGFAALDAVHGLRHPNAARKLARLLRWCEALRLPVVVLHGALPGRGEATAEAVDAAAVLQRCWAAASTTLVTVALDEGADDLGTHLGRRPTLAIGQEGTARAKGAGRSAAPAADLTVPAGQLHPVLARILADLPPERPEPWSAPYAAVDREANLFSKR